MTKFAIRFADFENKVVVAVEKKTKFYTHRDAIEMDRDALLQLQDAINDFIKENNINGS